MNLIQLSYFRQIVKSGTVTAAARIAYVTQPAITKQMRRLEDELDCKVFCRSGRRMRLTPQGELLNRKAVELLDGMKSLQE